MKVHDKHFIDGRWVSNSTRELINVINPSTGEVIARVAAGAPSDAERAIEAAKIAFPAWAAQSVDSRVSQLRDVLHNLRERREALVETIIDELGAPASDAKASQVDLPLDVFGWICDLAPQTELTATLRTARILREPVGVVSCITPWNYPLHQVIVKVVSAMVMGCTVILKPSEVVPLAVLEFADAFADANFPAGVFNLVMGEGPVVGEVLASHRDVDMVSFTGSTRAGIRVAELAAQTIKRLSLELGGKSASIVLPGADLNKAVKGTIARCFENSGQACSALTRLLVPNDQLTAVEDIAAVEASTYLTGDPRDPSTRLGPLVSENQRRRVEAMVSNAISEGARLLTGGDEERARLPERGFYVAPTVFTNVTPDMEIARQEVFGPVLSIIGYETVEDAVHLANDTDYGLSGAVWAETQDEAIEIAKRLRTGQVIVNGGAWNFDAPFGGYRQSGLGRESGVMGLGEFLETKALRI